MNSALPLDYGGRSGAKRRWLIHRWYYFLIGTIVAAMVLAWFYLPVVAPAFVIKYCPWDGPYFRAALQHDGDYAGDVQYLAAKIGVRYDRVLKRANTDPAAAVELFSLGPRLHLDGGAGEIYSEQQLGVVYHYTDEQLADMADRLDRPARDLLLQCFAFEDQGYDDWKHGYPHLKSTYPKLAAKLLP